MNGHRVAGIVSAGISRYDTKALGENIYNLAFTFIAPLGPNDYG